jgi:NAD(P)-dependent dehydrogenase (short-subunit alcohol dehydrogenase family)
MAIRNFADKVAVITGGGSGIGRALAQELASRGCDLALVDVGEEGMLETRSSVDEHRVHVSTHIADVSSEQAMRGLPARVLDAHGKVNLLFNNAGITLARTFEGHSLEDWERIIGINLWGVIYGCHFFLPHLKQQAGEAHIVNLSSMVAFMGPPGQSSYAATKSAIKGLSESLWAELRGEGIGVTVVHPGAIRTAIMQSALERAEDRGAFARTKAAVDLMAMSPDRAARIILKAVRGNRMRVVVGPDARLFESAKRAMPEQIHRIFVTPWSRQ